MAIVPARRSLKVYLGETFHYRFQWVIQSGTSSVPQDLTGYTGTWKIVPTEGSIPWMIYTESLTNDGSGIIFNGETGLIDLIISLADVEEITWKQALYELKVVDPATKEVTILLTGRLTAVAL